MRQICCQNVWLEDIHVNADSHGFSCTNCAHGGNGGLSIVKSFAPVTKTYNVRTFILVVWVLWVWLFIAAQNVIKLTLVIVLYPCQN